MRITLIHNPTAGYDSHHREELLELLSQAGYQVTYQSTDDEQWEKALKEPGELIVVAGGDGTVDDVAPLVAGREIPLALLPLGTANNIATCLGIEGEPAALIADWDMARRRPFNLGLAKGPWGKQPFVEAAGFGLFAQMMPLVDALGSAREHESGEENVRHDIETLKALLEACRATAGELELDDKTIRGEFLWVEVMNIAAVGPGLRLAPNADPGDGLLDIVLIEEKDREQVDQYLADCLKLARPAARFRVRQAKRVKCRWQGATIHLDSSLWGAGEDRPPKVKKPKKNPPATVTFRLEPDALEILAPSETT